MQFKRPPTICLLASNWSSGSFHIEMAVERTKASCAPLIAEGNGYLPRVAVVVEAHRSKTITIRACT